MGRIVPGNETSEGETPRFQGRTYRKISFTCSGLQPSEKGASIFLPERSLVSFPGQIPYLVTHSPTELGSRAECIRPSGTGECPVVAKHSQNSSLGDLQQPWPQVCSGVTKPQVAQPWDISTFGRVFSHPLASLMPPQSYSHWPDPEPSDSSPKNCDNPQPSTSPCATEYEKGIQELQWLLHWLRALQQLPAHFPPFTLPQVQSLAQASMVMSKQQEMLETNQGAAQPSLAPGHCSRAVSGLCSAPKEGKQQLCFLWRHKIDEESKRVSAVH